MSFRVSCKVSLGFHLWFLWGSFMVSLRSSFRFSCRVSYWDFFRVSLGFTSGLSRVSFRIQTEQNKAKENEKQKESKDRKQRNKREGSRAAKTHD